jgi:hypothetical protein
MFDVGRWMFDAGPAKKELLILLKVYEQDRKVLNMLYEILEPKLVTE